MKKKIVVIDDDQKLNKLLTDYLSKFDFTVTAFTHPKEGLKALKREMPDLIISDVIMPQLDGISLLRKLKGHLQTSMIPVILLTSKDEVESEVEGLEAGADDYIPKPIVAGRLLARINRVMSLYGRAHQGGLAS